MKLKEYSTYEEYVASQRRTDSRKTGKPCIRREEVAHMAAWLRDRELAVLQGICHGARRGHEVDWFCEEFPDAEVWGTDLFLKGHPRIVEWDFSKKRRGWIGRFSFVYTNALDHTRDPAAALNVWFKQLAPGGVLFVQWSLWHRRVRGGDCFGAEFHEYVQLLDSVGTVADVIYHRPSVVTIVSRSKQ